MHSRHRFFTALFLSVALGIVGRAAADDEPGFVSLFDGQSFHGWTGATQGYAIEDGRLYSRPDGGGNLFTEREYGDFVLRFEFKLTPGANNGLGIRCPLTGAPHLDGMELQILDDSSERYKDIKVWQHHGSIYGVVPAKTGYLKPVGEWNQEEVVCQGPHVQVILNGTTIVDAQLDQVSRPTLDGKDHPGLSRPRGHIGFLGHNTQVDFRNIRIKEAPPHD
jgi:3-keto-disaccharide hydrolase